MALLWRIPGNSVVLLAPIDSLTSDARGVSKGQQVGGVSFVEGKSVAALWTGTAESFVNLNPAGADSSGANDVSNGWQVGSADFNGVARAGYWRGTSESWTDLHSYLPGEYTSSQANGIAHLAGITYIIGTATTADRREAVLWVRDSAFSVSLNAPSVVGGVVTSGTVTFDIADVERRLVRMFDNSGYVLMNAYCSVPANQTTGTFTIWTYGVASSTVATISAYYSGATRTTNLTLTPATLDLLWLTPTAVVGGNPSMGNLRLVGKAPPPLGALVTLTTSDPAAANHASLTVISWGASLKQFPVSTFGVDMIRNVTISATYAGVTRTANLSVHPAMFASLNLASSTVTGGTPVTATVSMTGKTGPSGRAVLLSSNHQNIVVPGSMYVPPQKFSWNFTVLTQAVTSTTVGTITASQGATVRTATLTLTP
ncbi:MAG: hypothetical protein IT363_14945 [Methanoregulaceae archaeon]|nr:hypothetical protein [Methanoregulaceae archaeon]